MKYWSISINTKKGQSVMMPRPRPETNENLATKARRHKGFIYNKTFCVTLCLGVFVANFMAGKKTGKKMKTNNNPVLPKSRRITS
jgi:hypothetical protein